MKEFKCEKCGSSDVFIATSGNQTGLYCGDCGKWIKWLTKPEILLVNRFLDSKNPSVSHKLTKDMFTRICVNSHTSISSNGESYFVYMRDDLTKLSKEAFERGEDVFYTQLRNKDDNETTGELIAGEPRYKYFLDFGLTESEFDKLFN